MGTGYVRNDTGNNIADGNVINASDLDGEFDAVQAAFNASTGHSHDGTTGEGPQIETAGLADDAVTGAKIDSSTTVTAASFVGPLTGNASTASTLATARDISLTGDVTGSVSFDGSANASITATITDDSHNHVVGNIDNFTENVQDIAGAMFSGNTESGITATYQDADGTIDLNVNDPTITLTGDVSGSATMTNLGNVSITTTVADDSHNHVISNIDNLQTTLDGKANLSGATFTGNVSFGDNDKAIFGGGSDLQIYHDGSNSYVQDAGTGTLRLQGATSVAIQTTGGNNMAQFVNNGAVNLFHNANQKLATTSIGVDVTGRVVADSIQVQDNDKIIVGSSGDMEIYHDGSNSIIADVGTGGLEIKGATTVVIRENGTDDKMFRGTGGGAAELFYDNAAKLATTSDGVDITGEIFAYRGRGDTETASKTGTVTPDMDRYQNFVWTLTGNITLGNPGDEATGQSGFFIFIHSGAARTVSLSSDWETAGAAGLTLSGASGAVDIVPYVVQSAGNILLGAPQLAFS